MTFRCYIPILGLFYPLAVYNLIKPIIFVWLWTKMKRLIKTASWMRCTDICWQCFSLRPLPNTWTIVLPLDLPFGFVCLLLFCHCQIHGVILGGARKWLWPSLSELWSESCLVLLRFFFPPPTPLQTRKVAAESRTVAMATSWQLPRWVTVLISEEAWWEGVELWGGKGRLLCT